MSDIRQLKQFIAVAEEKHFRHAAERLNMTQPPLSQAIMKLEQNLGVQLLSRNRKKVELTSAGEVFLRGAYETIARMSKLESDTKRAAEGLIGRLSIGFPGSAIYEALPQSIRKFRQHFPDIQLEITERSTLDQVDSILKGDQDIGFLRPPITNEALFDVYPLSTEELVIVLPSNHPRATAERVDLRDFANEDFITFAPETSPNLHSLVFKTCMGAGFTPHITQTAPQIQTHISLVSAGLGVALVPECAAQITHPNVTFRRLSGIQQGGTTTMALACRKDDQNIITRSFIKVLTPPPA